MKVNVADQAKTYTLKAADYYDQDITVGIDSPDPLVVKMVRRPIVDISASPAGVEVYENDALIGAAPLRQEILTSRTFEFRKAGYFTQTLTLTGAPPYEVAVELKAFPVITVSATPADAKITHKGEMMGNGSAKLAVGGKATLEVSADRYYPQTVVLTPESPAQVDVALKAMPYVMISQPVGAEVVIDGKSAGTIPVELLIEKETAAEIRKEGFVSQTVTLTGADKQINVTLEPVPAVVETEVQAEEASAAPAVPEAAPAPAENNTLLWLAGAAVAVIAGLIFFLIKRKKK
jgi:hypothetical protein